MKNVQVELGGKKYLIVSLNMKKAREWRKRLAGPVGTILDTLAEAPDMDITKGQNIGKLVEVVRTLAMDSVDILNDALFAYSPVLAADRKRIEEEADDQEAFDALLEVLKMAYPFGSIQKLFSPKPGPASPETMENSPSPNGDSKTVEQTSIRSTSLS